MERELIEALQKLKGLGNDHDLIVEMRTDMKYVRRQVDDNRGAIQDMGDKLEEHIKCIADRMDAVEAWKNRYTGGLILLGFLVTTLIAIVSGGII